VSCRHALLAHSTSGPGPPGHRGRVIRRRMYATHRSLAATADGTPLWRRDAKQFLCNLLTAALPATFV